MTTIIRNYQKDELISDAQDIYTHYTFEELDGAKFLTSCDITGAEIYHLTNDKIAWIQSIDLDWVLPKEEKILRTTSYKAKKKKYTMTYEQVFHHLHEVFADSLEEAERLFEDNKSNCVDTQETWNTTDIEEITE